MLRASHAASTVCSIPHHHLRGASPGSDSCDHAQLLVLQRWVERLEHPIASLNPSFTPGAFQNPLCCPCYLCACCGGLGKPPLFISASRHATYSPTLSLPRMHRVWSVCGRLGRDVKTPGNHPPIPCGLMVDGRIQSLKYIKRRAFSSCYRWTRTDILLRLSSYRFKSNMM